MSDKEFSAAVQLSHQLAVQETVQLEHEDVLPDLSICGITKLEDMLKPNLLREMLPAAMIQAFIDECQQMLGVLQRHNLNPRQMRRALRDRIGKGGHPQTDRNAHISRSDETREAFEQATTFADEARAPEVNVNYLLAALLKIPNTKAHQLLSEKNINVEMVIRDLLALPVPKLAEGTESRELGNALEWLGKDLIELARRGEISETIGRRAEIEQVLVSLMRTQKNNPVLIGEPGVGKTAIVEGIAYRIANGNIHEHFKDMRIIQIDIASLLAGTKYRGDFEARLHSIIETATKQPNIILFIDEIHMLIGAGAGTGDALDAANILKPALSRGNLKVIGATTEKEYQKYIESDPALERRFTPVRVLEPTPSETREILNGARRRLEAHHRVLILDDALKAAVLLSVRHMPQRRLPDKAYELLDMTCAHARLAGGISFRAPDENQIKEQRGIEITVPMIYNTLSSLLGRHIEPLVEEKERLSRMAAVLKERVIGQPQAIDQIVTAIQLGHAGLRSRDHRPVGVFLLVGPTGVGKTELAKEVARYLYEDPKALIRLDMNEYLEKHSVARLIGAPPGYVGYDEGGQLTDALRRRPEAVVLLDEVEKAHPDIMNIFMSMFDEGRITDSKGVLVDATQAIFMMTSNIGFFGGHTPTEEEVMSMVRASFRPEMVGRFDSVLIFQQLTEEDMRILVQKRLETVRQWLESRQIKFKVADAALNWLATHGFSPDYGARPLLNLIDRKVNHEILRLQAEGKLMQGRVVELRSNGDELQVIANSGETG